MHFIHYPSHMPPHRWACDVSRSSARGLDRTSAQTSALHKHGHNERDPVSCKQPNGTTSHMSVVRLIPHSLMTPQSMCRCISLTFEPCRGAWTAGFMSACATWTHAHGNLQNAACCYYAPCPKHHLNGHVCVPISLCQARLTGSHCLTEGVNVSGLSQEMLKQPLSVGQTTLTLLICPRMCMGTDGKVDVQAMLV